MLVILHDSIVNFLTHKNKNLKKGFSYMSNSYPLDPFVNPNTFPCINQLFGMRSENAWQCVNKNHFPRSNQYRSVKVNDLAMVRLLYLATLSEASGKNVFSKRHLSVLQKCDDEALSVQRWLRYGFLSVAIVVLAAPYLAFVPTSNPLVSSVNSSANNSCLCPPQAAASSAPTAYAILIVTAIGLIAVVTTYVSWNSTGWKPDSSSNAYNAKQDTLRVITKIFDDMAKRLIRLHYSPAKEEAEKIVQHTDLDMIHNQFLEHITNIEMIDTVLGDFKEAVLFVRSGREAMPESSDLVRFIEQFEPDRLITAAKSDDELIPASFTARAEERHPATDVMIEF